MPIELEKVTLGKIRLTIGRSALGTMVRSKFGMDGSRSWVDLGETNLTLAVVAVIIASEEGCVDVSCVSDGLA
jgi:hypothetical protein